MVRSQTRMENKGGLGDLEKGKSLGGLVSPRNILLLLLCRFDDLVDYSDSRGTPSCRFPCVFAWCNCDFLLILLCPAFVALCVIRSDCPLMICLGNGFDTFLWEAPWFPGFCLVVCLMLLCGTHPDSPLMFFCCCCYCCWCAFGEFYQVHLILRWCFFFVVCLMSLWDTPWLYVEFVVLCLVLSWRSALTLRWYLFLCRVFWFLSARWSSRLILCLCVVHSECFFVWYNCLKRTKRGPWM
jgi:hypothetical protein